MERLDDKPIPNGSDEIRCFCVGRNEAVKIPQFLEHHRGLGVDRFFYVDNGSYDESLDLLLAEDAVHIWSTGQPYQESRFGVDWQDALLRQFGVGHWCLLLDIDELFYFPYCDRGRTFGDFLNSLEVEGHVVAKSMMLDMYSDRSIAKTILLPGKTLFETCPFFDRPRCVNLFFEKDFQWLQWLYQQGVRQRLFSASANIRKYVLMKYHSTMRFSAGHHHFHGKPGELAQERTFLFHFKFLQGLVEYARESVERECHWDASAEYRAYVRKLEMEADLVLYDEKRSIRYRGTETFLENRMIPPPGSIRALSAFPAAIVGMLLK